MVCGRGKLVQDDSMSMTISLGPLVVATQFVLLALSALIGFGIARWVGGPERVEVARHLTRMVVIGVVAARLAFVHQYPVGYLESPLSILDIRDGGWDVQWALISAWIYTVFVNMKPKPTRHALVAGVAVTSLLWAVGSTVLWVETRKSATLPETALPTAEGGVESLAKYKGKPSLVNLWATWCPPCRREMPILVDAQKRHPEVNFVFLNQGESREVVQRFLRVNGHHADNVLLDLEGQAGISIGSRALPTTLLFDANGELVDTHVGELSPGSLAKVMAKLTNSTQK